MVAAIDPQRAYLRTGMKAVLPPLAIRSARRRLRIAGNRGVSAFHQNHRYTGVPVSNRYDSNRSNKAASANVSSDKLRQCARCTARGHKGATIQHPEVGETSASCRFRPSVDQRSTRTAHKQQKCRPMAQKRPPIGFCRSPLPPRQAYRADSPVATAKSWRGQTGELEAAPSPRRFATLGKIAWIAVAKYDTGLPIRNLQAVDVSAIADTEALADALHAEKRRFRQASRRLRVAMSVPMMRRCYDPLVPANAGTRRNMP